jgi:hypothetical protein
LLRYIRNMNIQRMNMPTVASAHPTLIGFLLRQTQTEQVPFAKLLNTSQARVSRIARGSGTMSDDEWEAAATTLAIGQPQSGETPVWIVTRFYPSGHVQSPPADADGAVAVFRQYRVARAVVAYLRDVAGIHNAYAVPVWRNFLRDAAAVASRADIKEFGASGGPGDVAAAVSEWLPAAVRALAMQPRPVAE